MSCEVENKWGDDEQQSQDVGQTVRAFWGISSFPNRAYPRRPAGLWFTSL